MKNLQHHLGEKEFSLIHLVTLKLIIWRREYEEDTVFSIEKRIMDLRCSNTRESDAVSSRFELAKMLLDNEPLTKEAKKDINNKK